VGGPARGVYSLKRATKTNNNFVPPGSSKVPFSGVSELKPVDDQVCGNLDVDIAKKVGVFDFIENTSSESCGSTSFPKNDKVNIIFKCINDEPVVSSKTDDVTRALVQGVDDFEWKPVDSLRVKIYWSKERKYFDGKVVRWNTTKKKWQVKYDDGDVQFHTFNPEKWKILPGNKKRVLASAYGLNK